MIYDNYIELQKLLEQIGPLAFKKPSSPWSGATLRYIVGYGDRGESIFHLFQNS